MLATYGGTAVLVLDSKSRSKTLQLGKQGKGSDTPPHLLVSPACGCEWQCIMGYSMCVINGEPEKIKEFDVLFLRGKKGDFLMQIANLLKIFIENLFLCSV